MLMCLMNKILRYFVSSGSVALALRRSCLLCVSIAFSDGLSLFYWKPKRFTNFGDALSKHIVERIVGKPVSFRSAANEKTLLAIGSIIRAANHNDVIWGSGISGKSLDTSLYSFKHLDIRAVRGPLTKKFIEKNFQITCPEVYGDPALLLPYLFPEFQKPVHAKYDYIIIPHYSEKKLFSKGLHKNVVHPTQTWEEVVSAILNSKLVISSSLHGIVVAEAFGIPARLLRATTNEPMFKYTDYYEGTGRKTFRPAYSVREALQLGGESPFSCDLQKLYDVFPIEFWGGNLKRIF